jgi:hypothetical protein
MYSQSERTICNISGITTGQTYWPYSNPLWQSGFKAGSVAKITGKEGEKFSGTAKVYMTPKKRPTEAFKTKKSLKVMSSS